MKTHWEVLVRTARLAMRHNVQDQAAAIAFWTFFSIFPFLIGVIALSGHFLLSEDFQARVLEALTETLPGSAPLVESNIDAVLQRRGTLSWVAILGLFWSSGKAFGAVTRAINQALEAKSSLPFFLGAARHFLMALVISIMGSVAIGLPVVLEVVLEPQVLDKFGLEGISLPRLEGWFLSFFLMFLVFGMIYRLAPYVRVGWRDAFPGALLAAVLFEIGKGAFVLYLDRFADFESVYGPLASIIVLLLWLYLSAVILVLGAEFNIALRRKDDPVP